jgi:hypothetical protein
LYSRLAGRNDPRRQAPKFERASQKLYQLCDGLDFAKGKHLDSTKYLPHLLQVDAAVVRLCHVLKLDLLLDVFQYRFDLNEQVDHLVRLFLGHCVFSLATHAAFWIRRLRAAPRHLTLPVVDATIPRMVTTKRQTAIAWRAHSVLLTHDEAMIRSTLDAVQGRNQN